jgi:DNA-binding MarR family transcriptional regulator
VTRKRRNRNDRRRDHRRLVPIERQVLAKILSSGNHAIPGAHLAQWDVLAGMERRGLLDRIEVLGGTRPSVAWGWFATALGAEALTGRQHFEAGWQTPKTRAAASQYAAVERAVEAARSDQHERERIRQRLAPALVEGASYRVVESGMVGVCVVVRGGEGRPAMQLGLIEPESVGEPVWVCPHEVEALAS